MTIKKLQEARELESDIWQTEKDIADLITIIGDYDNFGSRIEFKRNSDSFSRSFGSKKNMFRDSLLKLLEELLTSKKIDLEELKIKFKNL